jgi:predicted nucleic acid-binding protein
MFPDHFLDTNVLVGANIGWDRFRRSATEYLERTDRENIIRHTSQRAFNEGLGVFAEIREIGGGYLEHLSTYEFTTDCTQEDVRDHMLDCQSDYEVTENLSERQKKRLSDFIDDIYSQCKILDRVREDSSNGISNFNSRVTLAIKKATSRLHKDVKTGRFRLYQKSKKPRRRVRYDEAARLKTNLSNIILDNPNDVELLIDAHYLRNEYGIANLCFVTFDKKHFFGEQDKNKLCIEGILKGIYVQHPSYKPPTQKD